MEKNKEPKSYEMVVIIPGSQSEQEASNDLEKIEKILKSEKVQVLHTENWGKRPLVYPIKKQTYGYYGLFQFDSDPLAIAKIQKELELSEWILRFLLTAKIDYLGEPKVKSSEKRAIKPQITEEVSLPEIKPQIEEKEEELEAPIDKAIKETLAETPEEVTPGADEESDMDRVSELDKKLDEILKD